MCYIWFHDFIWQLYQYAQYMPALSFQIYCQLYNLCLLHSNLRTWFLHWYACLKCMFVIVNSILAKVLFPQAAFQIITWLPFMFVLFDLHFLASSSEECLNRQPSVNKVVIKYNGDKIFTKIKQTAETYSYQSKRSVTLSHIAKRS